MSDQLRLDLSGAPDVAQPLVGWRIWWARPSIVSTETEAGRWMLHSPFGIGPWPSREAMVARCGRRPSFMVVGEGLPRVHSSPGPECTCGLYALKDMTSAVRLADNHNPSRHAGRFMAVVLGEVSLWGTVVVAQRGYRAQFAYPRRLWVVPDGNNRARQSDDGVVDGLEHYGIEFPDRETTPHPISSLLWRLGSDVNGFDVNRRDAMVTAVQEPGLFFISFAGARARVLDARASILYGEQPAADILSVGTWESSGYISRFEMREIVYRVRATREPWPPSINR